MRIVITGASGFVGSHLSVYLKSKGYSVTCIKHGFWNCREFEHATALIHLAGAPIADRFWTKARKKVLYSSRCETTRLLGHIIKEMKYPPKVFICASAIGYYGNRPFETLTEESEKGSGFLSDLCEEWERSTDEIAKLGIRVVNCRFGIILGKNGGMLQKLLKIFRLGLGAVLGSGSEIISWVSILDVIRAIEFCLEHPTIHGPVNIVSVNPVDQRSFTKILAKTLQRPAFFSIPSWFLSLCLGQRAKELLLCSQKVLPQKLLKEGFSFIHTDLEKSLKDLLLKN